MRSSLIALLIVSLTDASPFKRGDSPVAQDFDVPPGGDVTLLNYALTLEHLEQAFYAEGLSNYTHEDFVAAGFPDPFYCNLRTIYEDEKTHVDFISSALRSGGAQPVSAATYAFPAYNARSFIGLASVLEAIGVSAYAGAAESIINKAYLRVAGTILPVEARHSSYLRAALGEVAFPHAFDTPLDFNQVHSLASQLIVAFPENFTLPFKAFPHLVIAARPNGENTAYRVGSPVTFTAAHTNAIASGLVSDEQQPIYAVIFSGLDIFYVRLRALDDGDLLMEAIPTGEDGTQTGVGAARSSPQGQIYVLLSTADGTNRTVRDANTLSGVGVLEVLDQEDS